MKPILIDKHKIKAPKERRSPEPAHQIIADNPFPKGKLPRKNLAREALRIRAQETMQGTDLLMVFTKPECKDHRSKNGEEPDWLC